VAGIGCNLNKPTITSQNPHVLPTVIPNYLQISIDRQLTRELVRTGYRVITSPSMQALLELPVDLTESIIKSDALLDEYTQSHVTSAYHFCCTCRMASRESGGVVDQSGRVYGVRGLRVCDASVLPTVPASNTMWTTVMVVIDWRISRYGDRESQELSHPRDSGLKRLPSIHTSQKLNRYCALTQEYQVS
jgi:choline dehydrogenase-like flavoprotein